MRPRTPAEYFHQNEGTGDLADTCDIAVIGAGVVGLAVALRLASEGREVVVIDPAEPGSGASYGNAGTIADYAVQPVGTPDVLRSLPSLLFDRNSPLTIRRSGLLALMPWLMRFARQSLPAVARRNAVTLAGMLADAGPRWDEMAKAVGATGLIQSKGCLYTYATERARRSAEPDIQFRRSLGVEADVLSPDALAALEPDLPHMPGGAVHFPQARFLSDPGRVVGLLALTAKRAGVRFLRAEISTLRRDSGGVALGWDGGALMSRRAVIAAGAHSRRLAAMAGDRAPLDTERGYHLEFDMAEPRLTRPVAITARGFYLCPMRGRLRVAGTVELGGLTAPPSQHRLDRLLEGARGVFPDLPEPSRTWMGFRPSMPDSLPVIGPSAAGDEILHAFGHGHIGLTLAPITAEIIADLISGRPARVDTTAFRVDRF